MMLLQQSAYSNITGTGSQVTPGFPHSQFRLRVASPKVRERDHTTPVAYELASDTCYGLGVVTPEPTSYAWDISHALVTTYHPYCQSPSALTEYLKQKLRSQRAKRLGRSLPAQVEPNIQPERHINSDFA